MPVSDSASILPLNTTPKGFDPVRDLPTGFFPMFQRLHAAFGPRRDALIQRRREVLATSLAGNLPQHLPPSEITTGDWRIQLPTWCQDQRNQMTGPADDAELVVKMLNSGAPGVMMDLEDSMANTWPILLRGISNALGALYGALSYNDVKRNQQVAIKPSIVVATIRPRGLALSQGGIIPDELTPAPLFDMAMIVHQANPARLKHPLCFYIPKSESAEEALWWRDLFRALAAEKNLPPDAIKCMALMESHPIAFQMEEFVYNLRDHILALNLGRWDYMASLIHFNLHDPAWVLPDRNTIPHDVAFFQNLRVLIPEICHKRGILAIGGMTALYPSRGDAALNTRALKTLEEDKHNEAACLMDGAWTGHPDQNAIAVRQFPAPNQGMARPAGVARYPDLRPVPAGLGKTSLAGTRDAVRTTIRYRFGVLQGKGASLLDGYMEDLATDRIYRLMIAQRTAHSRATPVQDDSGATGSTGTPVEHTPALITRLYDEELTRILGELPPGTPDAMKQTYREARAITERLITAGQFDPP